MQPRISKVFHGNPGSFGFDDQKFKCIEAEDYYPYAYKGYLTIVVQNKMEIYSWELSI